MPETITTNINPSSQQTVQLPNLLIPEYRLDVSFKTNKTGIWFKPDKYPCCGAGVLYSEKQADVVLMKDNAFHFPASEHRILPPMQKDQIIFPPTIAFQFTATGNPVVSANANRFKEENMPAQMLGQSFALVEEILQEKEYTRCQVETDTYINCKYKLTCTDEEKLTALSRLQVIKQMMQQHSLEVITPVEGGQRLSKHLNLRFDAQRRVREEYMKLKNLTCSQPPNNFSFAFSKCADVLQKIDTAQRHAMQESSVRTSACAERCVTAFIQSSAPLAVNWTVQSGLPLTAENTANQVMHNFRQDFRLCVQQLLKEITGNSVTTELSEYQADAALKVVHLNNEDVIECDSCGAGECQQYNNMFVSQVVCNQLMRKQKSRPVSLYSAACAADDCEGGACSIINVMLYLKCNSEEKIKDDILQACQCIDEFTGNSDPTTLYATHKDTFAIMALNVKQYLQQETIQVGVASLLASAQRMTQNNEQVSNEECSNVQNFENYWKKRMKDGDVGGHAAGLVHESVKDLEVKFDSEKGIEPSKQLKYVVHSLGTTQNFLQSCYMAEGTAPSQQQDTSKGLTPTKLNFRMDQVFTSCNDQQQNAIQMLRQKYDKQTLSLNQALNVSTLLATALNFSAISEIPSVKPTNYFSLGAKDSTFYDTLLLSADLLYCTENDDVLVEGVDLTGRLKNSKVTAFQTCIGNEERRLCELLDMGNHNHLLKSRQVFEVRKQAGMVPSALPDLVRTNYNACAFEVERSIKTHLPMTLTNRKARVTGNNDALQLQINLRFPEFTQVRSLEERQRLIMARKLEIGKMCDKRVEFQQGAYTNLMQLFIDP